MTEQKPYTPPVRGKNYYAAFKNTKQEITARLIRKELFTISITAATQQHGESMDYQVTASNEQQFLIDLVFKPKEPGLKLHPEETQLLLAYIGEILKQIEAEEKRIIEEEPAK